MRGIKINNIKIILLLILFINLYFLLYIYVNEENEIVFANKEFYLKLKIIRIINYYISICLKNKLILKNIEIKKNPKISIIVPVYNGGKYFLFTQIYTESKIQRY